MATQAQSRRFDGDMTFHSPIDIEPDENWKESTRSLIQSQLQHLVDAARQDRDVGFKQHQHDRQGQAEVQKRYDARMNDLRRVAATRYKEALQHEQRDRLERRWASGQNIGQDLEEAFIREQQVLFENASRRGGAHPRNDPGPSSVYHDNNDAGSVMPGAFSLESEPSASQAASDLGREGGNLEWYRTTSVEQHDQTRGATGAMSWANWAPPMHGAQRQARAEPELGAGSKQEIWRPSLSSDNDSIKSFVPVRPPPRLSTPSQDRLQNANVYPRAHTPHRLAEFQPSRPISRGPSFGEGAVDYLAQAAQIAQAGLATLVGMHQDNGPRPSTPQLRARHPHHLVQFADRAQSVTPKPHGQFIANSGPRVAPTPLRAVENIQLERSLTPIERTPTNPYFAPNIPSALRTSTITPHPPVVPRKTPSGTNMQMVDPRSFNFDDDTRSIRSPFDPATVFGKLPSQPRVGDAVRPPPPSSQPSWSSGSNASSASIASSASSAPSKPKPEPNHAEMFKPQTIEEPVIVASDEGDSEWELAEADKEDLERVLKEGVGQFSGDASPETILDSFEESSKADVVFVEQKPALAPAPAPVAGRKPPKVTVAEEPEEEQDVQETPVQKKHQKGGKTGRKQEQKRKEQEARQKEQEAKRAAEEAKRKEKEAAVAKLTAEENKRKEQEAKRVAEETKRKEIEAKRLEEQMRQKEEIRKRENEHRRWEEDPRRSLEFEQKQKQQEASALQLEADRLNRERIEAFRKQQEELQRRLEGRQRTDSTSRLTPPEAAKLAKSKKDDQDAARLQAQAARHDEETHRREEQLRRMEEEMVRKEEELKRREQDILRREKEEEMRRKAEEKQGKQKPGVSRKKEDELRDKEEEVRRLMEDMQKQAEELRKREEALNQRAEAFLAMIRTQHDVIAEGWLQAGGKLTSVQS